MGEMWGRRAILGLAAGGGLALAGCTGDPSGKATAEDPDKPTLTELGPFLRVAQGLLPLPNRLDTGLGHLITPHSRHRMTATGLAAELPPHQAVPLKIPPFRAAPGYEIVLAAFAMPDAPVYVPGKGEVTATVVTGKSTLKVDMFGSYNRLTKLYSKVVPQTVVACVPKGQPVRLRVTDAGRTAVLDLRTGKRGTDPGTAADPAYYRDTSDNKLGGDYLAKGAVITRPGGRFIPEGGSFTLTFDLDDAFFTLEPWSPAGGWAPAGRLWAVLGGVTVTGAIADTANKKRKLFLDTVLDVAGTFTLTPAGGSPLKPRPGKHEVPLITGVSGSDAIDPAWTVPASFTRGTVRIAPDVKMKVTYKNAEVPAIWSARPKPHTIPVDLRG